MKLLDCLAKHFPIQEKGVKINFSWQDFVGKKRGGTEKKFKYFNFQDKVSPVIF